MTHPSELLAARAKIDLLPQRAHLTEGNITKWLAAVDRHEPERLMWHVTRLAGFGGSEIGALVMNSRGQTAAFSSARKICMQKLMILAPDASSPEMQRGIDTEPLNRQMFLKLFQARQDHRAIEVLTHAVGKYPYLRYSPDDVVLLRDEDQVERRVLVDYKSPTELGELDEYSFEYHCQINMGAGIMKRAGIPADAGILSRLTWQGWSCHCNWVGLDPHLQNEIEAVAHDYWTQSVLIGDLPPLPRKIEVPFELPAPASEEIRQLSARIVALDTVVSTLKKESEALRAKMDVTAAPNAPVGSKLTVFAHDFTVNEELNPERLQSTLQAAGLDWDEERAALQVPKTYDVDALVQRLVDSDVDVSPLVVEHEWNIPAVKARLAELEIDENNAFNQPVAIRKKGNFKKFPAPLHVQTEFLGHGEHVKARVLDSAAYLLSPKSVEADDVESVVEEGETMLMVG